MELLDQGKQTEHVHVPDRIGPLGSSAKYVFGVNGEGVMEMRDSGDVPGEACQGACAETAFAVD